MKAHKKSKLATCGATVGIAMSTILIVAGTSQAHSHPVFMPTGDSAPPPSGWFQFCVSYRAICKTTPLPAREVKLDEQAWRQLKRVNDWVNHNIRPMDDMAHYGIIQWWRYPDDGVGACHSYALLKQRLLVQAGWPRQALLMTVVRDRDGEGHAVLTVRTNGGDYILDNLTDRIRLWSDTRYEYVEVQSQTDPNRWVSTAEPAAASAVQEPPPASEVSVGLKPIKWPTWHSVQIGERTQEINFGELPPGLAAEMVDRIQEARAAAAKARRRDDPTASADARFGNPASTTVEPFAVRTSESPASTADVPPDGHSSTAVAPFADHTSATENDRWGVQLIGSSSKSAALASYHHLQQIFSTVLGPRQPLVISTNIGINAHWYRVRVVADDRSAAESLCSSLRAAGGTCLVQRD